MEETPIRKERTLPRVVHFKLPADEPERASRFYSDVFGWTIKKWDGPMDYWTIQSGEAGEMGIDGGMMKRADCDGPVVNTIGVGNLDEYAEKVTASGGQITMPKHAIPGLGYFAYAKDSQGNSFGMVEPDAGAGV